MSLTPAKSAPQRITLDGRYVRLEPIGPQHVDGLWACAGDERYRWLFEYPPKDAAEMAAWIAKVSAQDDPLMFAVVDPVSGEAVGRQALMRIVPEHGVIEIGSILWGDRIARTRVATEALFLFAKYAFDELGYRRFEWKCNALNLPSRAAAERFGFVYEGTFHQHMIWKGQNRDTAWYAMLDTAWPRLKAGYERWLDPDNFEPDGTQKSKLRF